MILHVQSSTCDMWQKSVLGIGGIGFLELGFVGDDFNLEKNGKGGQLTDTTWLKGP